MFLHPAILILGVAAAALPVLIHWLTRPRPARMPLSTIRFVREAIAQRRASHRLRDALVLALRTLAVLLIAMAIARPLMSERGSDQNAEAAASTVRVVVVDLSQSMAAQAGGVSALERGRSLAADQLEFRPGLRANLILAAARPSAIFAAPSNNFAALREALAQAAVRPERLLVQPALNLAAQMLADAGPESTRRELVVISDFQRTNWTAADFSALPEETTIQLRSVAPPEPVANLALLRVSTAGRTVAGQDQRLQVEVGNFSPATRNVKAVVRLGDAAYELEGSVPALSKTTLTTTIRPPSAGWHLGEARLLDLDDRLSADDVRPFALDVPQPPTYLLITRQSEKQRPSSSYYLQRALAPAEADDRTSGHRVMRLAPNELDNQSLAAADLLVVDHPGKLTQEAIGVLAGQVRRGRGLLYVAAEVADSVNLKLLAEALGGSLKMPVEFQPASPDQPRRELTLASIRRQQAPFAVFGDELTSLTSSLRFSGGLTSRRLSTGLEEDVRATFSDGSAFLVAAASVAAPVVVLNADLERSSLPVSPLFVPLIAELTHELLGKHHQQREFFSGEPLVMAISASSQSSDEFTIAGGPPDGAEQSGEVVVETTGPLWRWSAAGPPAVYEVKQGEHTVAAAAVGIPAEESDLRSLSADVLEQRLAGQRDVHFHAWSPTSSERQDTLWTWLLIGCLGCIFGELAALRWFRS